MRKQLWFRWVRNAFRTVAPHAQATARRRTALCLEELEERTVPAFYLVGTTLDGAGSVITAGHAGTRADPFLATTLRAAVTAVNADANGAADTIMLPGVVATTYHLSLASNGAEDNATGSLAITHDVNIEGVDVFNNTNTDASLAIIHADATTLDRVLNINPQANAILHVLIQALTIQGGNNSTDALGGGIHMFGRISNAGVIDFTGNAGTLDLENCIVQNNFVTMAGNGGGGLLAEHVNTTINNCIFQNNAAQNGDGGGISAIGTNENLTITNTQISGNQAGLAGNAGEFAGGGLAIDWQGDTASATPESGAISISGATISNNSAGGRGGGVSLSEATNGGGVQTLAVAISSSTFSGNTSGDTTLSTTGTAEGGGVYFTGDNSAPLAVALDTDTFTANRLDSNNANKSGGGGVAVGGGFLNMSFSRLTGNTIGAPVGGANQGTGLHKDNSNGTVIAIENWWGSNDGPAAGPNADTAVVSGGGGGVGVINFQPFLVVEIASLAALVNVNTSTTVTADFLKDSAGNAVAAANLGALVGVPITFTATLGAISNADLAIKADGTASATYTAGANPGVGSASAQVDQPPPATVNITVDVAPIVNPPTVNPTTVLQAAITSFTIAGTFTQAAGGGGAPFTATINWGDGTHDAATVTGNVNPFNYSFTGSHTYLTAGIFSLSVTVSDKLGDPGTSVAQTITVSPTLGAFTYDPNTKTLTITGTNFTFGQSTTVANGTHTTYMLTMDNVTQSYLDTNLAHVTVIGAGASPTAILITSDTYFNQNNQKQETRESIFLGSRTDAGVGAMFKYDNAGNPVSFLTLSNFPISYAYVGRNDGTVQLFGTQGVAYNGFVSAGNYAYVGAPGVFHLAQGATSVYGYSAGQASDFAFHYAANAGSAYVASGTAFSYMSATETVGGVTQSYFNVGAGFNLNTGVAKNPGKDFAYIIDSLGNDNFVGNTNFSYMYIQNSDGSFAEFDAAYGFALVFGQSFVGGTDFAINNDPNKNILVGFRTR